MPALTPQDDKDVGRPASLSKSVTRRASESQTRQWLAEHNVAVLDSELAPGAAVIESGSLSPQSEPVREGWIYLQDEASQLVALTVDARPGDSDLRHSYSDAVFSERR